MTAGEIMRAQEALAPLADREEHALLPLFGDLPPEQQDRVLNALDLATTEMAGA